jgi:hypothetical protein
VSENDGIGVGSYDGNIDAVNSTVSGNYNTNIYTSSGTIDLTNVTVADSYDGDGVGNSGGSTTMTNTIVAGHGEESDDCSVAGTIGGGHNLDSDGSCPFGGTGNISDTDPMLDSIGDNGGPTFTMALLAGSPAIDAGTNSGCPGTDQRGVSRPVNGTCDMGAYEGGGEPDPTATATSTATPTGTSAPNDGGGGSIGGGPRSLLTPTPPQQPTTAPSPAATAATGTTRGGGAAGSGAIRLPDTGAGPEDGSGRMWWSLVVALASLGGLAAATGMVTAMRRSR